VWKPAQGASTFLDDRLQAAAAQVAGLDHVAVPVRERERRRVLVGLCRQMAAQPVDERRRQLHLAPAVLGLRRHEPPLDHRPADADLRRRAVKLEVEPLERDRLADPQAAGRQNLEQQPVAFRRLAREAPTPADTFKIVSSRGSCSPRSTLPRSTLCSPARSASSCWLRSARRRWRQRLRPNLTANGESINETPTAESHSARTRPAAPFATPHAASAPNHPGQQLARLGFDGAGEFDDGVEAREPQAPLQQADLR
jgi:hypothetical protein